MAQPGVGCTDALVPTSALTIRGLEPLPASTKPLDAAALMMEHVLASLQRVEVRLAESDRRAVIVPHSRPEPDPPYGMLCGWMGKSSNPRPLFSAAISVATLSPTGVSVPPSSGLGPQPFVADFIDGRSLAWQYSAPSSAPYLSASNHFHSLWDNSGANPSMGIAREPKSACYQPSAWDTPRRPDPSYNRQPMAWDNPAARL